MSPSNKRKIKQNPEKDQASIPTATISLPIPLVAKLLELKKRKGLEFLYQADVTEIFFAKTAVAFKGPFFTSRVQAGSPSPADEFMEGALDLNEHLIHHKADTFFVRVAGKSMKDAGIFPGDILIVDRALEAISDKIVIAVLNGELTVKRLYQHNDTVILCAENQDYADIKVTPHDAFSIWGVITYVIHPV